MANFFENRPVPSTARCHLRVPERTYRWLDSLALEDIQELRPCEKGWGRAEQNELHWKLRNFLAQPSTCDLTHVVIKELYEPPSSGFPGRLYNHKGAQSLYRPLRAHILAETADLDQSCAMQRILLWTCKQFGLFAPYLGQYVEQRDEKLLRAMQTLSITRSAAKQRFQIAWTSCKRLRGAKDDDFLRLYDEEAKRLQGKLVQIDALQWILPFCDEANGNLAGSFIAHVFQFVESRLTACVYEELQREGFEVAALIFDGLHLADGALFGSPAILDRAHAACERLAPGINMLWAWKPADYTIRTKRAQEDICELRIPDDFAGAHEDEEQAFLAKTARFDEHVIKVDCDYIDRLRDPNSSKEDIKKRYCHIQYYWTVAGKRRHAQFIHKWLDGYDGMTVYKRSDFVPPALECDPDAYNTWNPWPCTSVELTADRERLVYLLATVLKHVAILANHKKSNYDFIMKFFAQYVQFVLKKGGVLLILSGAQGCGKSTFVKLLKLMFGAHFFSTSKPEQNVWGRFNSEMECKTLVELSELDRGNVHGNIDHVKDLISSDTMWIEGKGTNGYTVHNYVRFLGITNDPVPVREGRRNGCVECSSELAYHKPFGNRRCRCARCVRLAAYHTEMNGVVMVDPNTARILFEYWSAYDLGGRTVLTEEDLPLNELQERVAEASLSQEARFLRHLAVSTDQTTFIAHELWRAFVDWREQHEPGHMHIIKGQADLIIKMGVLWSHTPGCTKSEVRLDAQIDANGAKRCPKVRAWTIDRGLLCPHLGITLDRDDDTQRTIPECVPEATLPDLDTSAREFVNRYLGDEVDEDAALVSALEAFERDRALERDLEDEEEIERLGL